MDNELILCDISQIMRQHNKLRGGIPSDVAVDRIRNIVLPRGVWVHHNDDYNDWYECSECGYGDEGEITTNFPRHCPGCGARMIKEGNNENVNGK